MRIAVVGAGISGMLAARLLADEHDVHVFEAEDRIGGHTHTANVTVAGQSFPADTGFMVFNERTYPDFIRMLGLLGVPARDSDMSFSVRHDPSGLEYQGGDWAGLFAQRRNLVRPAFYRMLAEILRFNREAPRLLEQADEGLTLDDFLRTHGYSQSFIEHYLAPMGASIWSTAPGRFREFPARYTVGFFRNHGLLQLRDRPQWRTIQGGAARYAAKLMQPLQDRIRLSCPVARIERRPEHVLVTPRHGASEPFDQVVLAVHSDQALAMLADPSPAEREILGAIPYQANEIVLHTDTTHLPRARRAWASWNCHVAADDVQAVTLTYDLSRLQGHRSAEPILETLNPALPITPARILGRLTFEHPQYGVPAIAAQRRHAEINGQRRTYYCGAYWGYGFHEDGARSALAVANCFGKSLDTGLA